MRTTNGMVTSKSMEEDVKEEEVEKGKQGNEDYKWNGNK